MNGEILVEDCRDTLERSTDSYNYIFTVPPDFNEIGLHPVNDDGAYITFLREVFRACTRKTNLITVMMTDRKYNGRIIPKNDWVRRMMNDYGFDIVSYKIWDKSGYESKINLYRLNFSQCITYAKKDIKPKRNRTRAFMYDVFRYDNVKYDWFDCGQPVEIVKIHIQEFTQPGDVVYDPFMGAGTTAIACIESNRSYKGSEISPKVALLAQNRIEKLEGEPIK
jgi:DNA modification methylase